VQVFAGPNGCSDFNGDGMSDVLWRNFATGEAQLMTANGTVLSARSALAVAPDVNWKIVQTGDFNGDGVTDIMWMNDVTTEVRVSMMAAGAVSVTQSLGQVFDPSYHAVQVIDLDGDGNSDIVWWHATTGNAVVWLMNGAAIVGNVVLPQQPDTRWRIVASGDFSGSGRKNQLVWRNKATGDVALQTLNYAGGALSTVWQSIVQLPDLGWKIVTAADIDGDGRSDLVWHHEITGQVLLSIMNGPLIVTQAVVAQQPDTGWKLVAADDYNGDGKADLLWRHDQGYFQVVLMNGFAGLAASPVALEPNTAWRIEGPYEYARVNARLVNLSTRAFVGTNNDIMIAGITIGGHTSKTVAIQAYGPSLAAGGIANPLPNPYLTLIDSTGAVVAANDDWIAAPNAAQIQALGLGTASGADAVILTTLAPGAYTALVSDPRGSVGVGLVSVLEVDQPDTPFVGVSTRALVNTGEQVAIGGFIIQGEGPSTVVLQAIGPALVPAGIPNALTNPVLQLFDAAGTLIAANDDWPSAANWQTIQASGLNPSIASESAMLVTLKPGAYTAVLSGVGGTTGVAIVNIMPW